MWPVEIYYQDFFEKNPVSQVRLQLNAAVSNEPNSYADNFVLFSRVWNKLKPEERAAALSSQKSFAEFLQSILQNVKASHWLPLIKHHDWREHIQKLISHPWGQSNLVIGNLTRCLSSHHPRVGSRPLFIP